MVAETRETAIESFQRLDSNECVYLIVFKVTYKVEVESNVSVHIRITGQRLN